MTAPPVLSLRGIRKRFGSVHALRGADFTLMPGELHALLGENGAGKTTLTRVAYGLVRPEAGEIAIDGVVRQIASPRVARRLGIGMVHQHPTSIPALSVAENVALAAGGPDVPPRSEPGFRPWRRASDCRSSPTARGPARYGAQAAARDRQGTGRRRAHPAAGRADRGAGAG